MGGAPDPKPRRREVDRPALARARLVHRTCAVCGRQAGGVHHVVPRGQRGGDVDENLVGLCGDGTRGCHGAVHGTPYERGGRRREPAEVRAALLSHLLAQRPDVVAYADARMGRGYLERRYGT